MLYAVYSLSFPLLTLFVFFPAVGVWCMFSSICAAFWCFSLLYCTFLTFFVFLYFYQYVNGAIIYFDFYCIPYFMPCASCCTPSALCCVCCMLCSCMLMSTLTFGFFLALFLLFFFILVVIGFSLFLRDFRVRLWSLVYSLETFVLGSGLLLFLSLFFVYVSC